MQSIMYVNAYSLVSLPLWRPPRCRVRRETSPELTQQFVGVAMPIVTPQLFDSLEPFFRQLIHEVSPQDGTARLRPWLG